MYIPFDNLYEWIACLEQDTVIYRFFPAGSKNLDDLQLVDTRYVPQDIPRLLPVVCHDQEPLQFDHYQNDHVITRNMHKRIDPKKYAMLGVEHAYWKAISDNLRSALCPGRFDKYVLLHSEKRSPEVEKYLEHAVPVFWWSHAMIALDWYRFAQHDRRLDWCRNKTYTKDFNVYARAWGGTREYRLTLLELLKRNQVLQSCRVTFGDRDNDVYFRDHVFSNPLLDLGFDGQGLMSSNVSSCRSAHYDVDHYSTCAIDLVMETMFDDPRLHLTEKVLRPLACGKPFMLVSTAGALQYLREYGFETFGTCLDESYDEISDSMMRLQSISQEMHRVASLSKDEKQKLYVHIHNIARRNRQRFFHQDFAKCIANELKNNLRQAAQTVSTNWGDAKKLLDAYATLGDQETLKADFRPMSKVDNCHPSYPATDVYETR